MMRLCPKCENEILPYLKTGDLKAVENNSLIKYQCYYCLHCQIVFYEEHEIRAFLNLKLANAIKQVKEKANGFSEKTRDGG